MKAFVSYSVTDNNEFILTLLSLKLREKKFIVNTSQNFYSKILDINTLSEINESHLFIGIITGYGNEKSRVIEEWQYAASKNIPNILLIEDTVLFRQNFTGNFIKFNREYPQNAIDSINNKMKPTKQLRKSNSDDTLPWILGGAALLAILALFSNDKK